MPAKNSILDMSYIHDVSGNEPSYIYELTGIFIETMAEGLPKLKQYIDEGVNFQKIHSQAHYLKSSAAIIKIRDNYDCLTLMDQIARKHTRGEEIEFPEIVRLYNNVADNYNEALPEILKLRKKNAPKPTKTKAAE
jgi:HPt (histidine-containing phosphotransfer) domain-containing protein